MLKLQAALLLKVFHKKKIKRFKETSH